MTPGLRETLEEQRAVAEENWECHPVAVSPHQAGRILHDFRRSAVRNLERASVPRSVAMKLVGHKTESVYRRYAIVDETMLRDGVAKLNALYSTEQAAAPAVVPLAVVQAG